MKKVYHILIVLTILALLPFQGQSQCKSFAKKVCKTELIPYIHDGNYNAAILTEGEDAELYKTFYAGQNYRIYICGSDALPDIEFQVIFLQHLLSKKPFNIIPILCGSLQTNLADYTRHAYLKKAKPFLEKLAQIVSDPEHEMLVVAGVDFSHIGLKFGHDRAADYLARQTEVHDKNLLNHLSRFDVESRLRNRL